MWSVALVVGALTAPGYAESSGAAGAEGEPVAVEGSEATLVEVNGTGVLVVVGTPLAATVVVVALLLLRGRHRGFGYAAWAVVALLAGFAVVGLLSIGMFVLPAVVALAVAVAASRPLATTS